MEIYIFNKLPNFKRCIEYLIKINKDDEKVPRQSNFIIGIKQWYIIKKTGKWREEYPKYLDKLYFK
jgi:hypothetical protein